jgi:Ca2+-binding RTX toxin-like protein
MTVRHLFVIDSRLPDVQTLRAALPPDSDWAIVDAQADGVAQLESITARYAGLESIHLLAHGRPGALLLGSGWLTADTVRDQSPALARIGASLAADGDILVYGCETGTGTAGQRLIEALAQASGAAVAASVDSTGAQSLGGNWALERRAGEVSTAALDAPAYPALLGTMSFPGLQHEYVIDDTVSRSGILISGPGSSETFLDADLLPRELPRLRELSVRSYPRIEANSLSFADATVSLVVADERWVSDTDLFHAPSVAALAGGEWIVSWTATNWDTIQSPIYAQRYDSVGATVSATFSVNSDYWMQKENPSVAALSDGGWIVAWQTRDGDWLPDSGIYAHRYGADGAAVGAEFQVNTDINGDRLDPSAAALSDGGWIIAWASEGQDGSDAGIYAQRYGATGAAGGAEFRVNSYTSGDQAQPCAAALSDGGWIIAWASEGQDGSDAGIFAQRYGANGAAGGAEFRVNSHTNSDQAQPCVAALADGGWVIVWESEGQDGSGAGIFAQRYGANGAAGGAEFRVNSYTNSDQAQPSVAALADGGWVISWFLSLMVPNGQASVVKLEPGWYSGIYQQRYGADGQPVEQVIRSITGDATAQSLVGGAGNDIIYALSGDDTLEGRAGADSLFGGPGNDTYLVDSTSQDAIYEQSGEGTDLIVSTVTTWLPSDVENLTLSGTGHLAGDGNYLDNTITGNSGNNMLNGYWGDDTLLGGEGLDTAIYDTAIYRSQGVQSNIVRLPNGDIQVDETPSWGVGDTLHDVERAVFLNGAVGFDIEGTGGQAYRLYQTVFDRVPDETGVGFWIDRIDRGFSLVDAADILMTSAEFKDLYGESPSNEHFMYLLYAFVMNRAPDPGYYFWLDALYGRGQFEGTVFSRPFVLAQFSESPENQANVIGAITNGFWYEPLTPQ